MLGMDELRELCGAFKWLRQWLGDTCDKWPSCLASEGCRVLCCFVWVSLRTRQQRLRGLPPPVSRQSSSGTGLPAAVFFTHLAEWRCLNVGMNYCCVCLASLSSREALCHKNEANWSVLISITAMMRLWHVLKNCSRAVLAAHRFSPNCSTVCSQAGEEGRSEELCLIFISVLQLIAEFSEMWIYSLS